MILSNSQQLAVLLWSLLFGVCLGIAYDFLRMFRFFVRCPAVSVLFQDLFYFLAAAIASFLFIFEVNDGTVRLFILLSFLFGGLAERFTIGFLLIRLCARIKKFSVDRKMQRQNRKNITHNTHSPKARDTDCVRESSV